MGYHFVHLFARVLSFLVLLYWYAYLSELKCIILLCILWYLLIVDQCIILFVEKGFVIFFVKLIDCWRYERCCVWRAARMPLETYSKEKISSMLTPFHNGHSFCKILHLGVWFHFLYFDCRGQTKLLSLQLYTVRPGCFDLLVRGSYCVIDLNLILLWA
jgi:hypothetical protein